VEQRVRSERGNEYRSPPEHFRAWAPEYWPEHISKEEGSCDEVGNLFRSVKRVFDKGASDGR